MSMAKALRNQKAVRKAQAKRAKAMEAGSNHKTLDQQLETIRNPMEWLLCAVFIVAVWCLIFGVFFL